MFAERLVTAAVLLALFSAALLLLPNEYWGVFLLVGLFVAGLEWGALAGYRRAGRWVFAGIVLVSGFVLLHDSQSAAGAAAVSKELHVLVYWIAAAFWLLLAPAWLITEWRSRNAVVMALAGWIVLVPAWLALTALQTTPGRLLVLVGVVWIADSAAYLSGRRFGRHRLAPRVSPGKTWEGVIGACVAVAVYYAVVCFLFAAHQPVLDRTSGMILYAVVTVMSVQGDLFESWIKRQAGVKDSGTLFPGHGGMLDRIDGLTASMPLAALWLHYLDRPGMI